MATRFTYKALAAAALGIALSLLPGGTTSAAPSNAASELLLDPPEAPSNCNARRGSGDPKNPPLRFPYVSWRDNSSNEDGFIVETWQKVSGTWYLTGSETTQANSTSTIANGVGPNWKYRVKAFNAAGDSDWSNWGH